MYLELILLIVVLYVLYEQHRRHQVPAGRRTVEQPIIPIPSDRMPSTIPEVTVIDTKNREIVLAVTPTWYEPVKVPSPDKIRLPRRYNKDSPVEVRTFKCLSEYRCMKNKSHPIDFVTQPFTPAVDNTETVVVILNELVHQLGGRLSFSEKAFQYDDSDYRTACGVGNLGSIHSLIAAGDNTQTAEFRLHLKLNYDEITSSTGNLRNFTVTLINGLADLIKCKKEYIGVFSIMHANSINVDVGLTTPDLEQTKKLAEELRQRLNHLSPQQQSSILQYLISESYNYKLKSAIHFLQLQESDFDPRFNRDYPDEQEETRGGRPYYFPQGWYRHALKVKDKYPDDQVWLGMNDSPGEWLVAYHGTKAGVVKNIKDTGLQHKFVTADVCEDEAKLQKPSIPDVKGLYVATHCEGGAAIYAKPGFEVEGPPGTIKTYYVVFQCRVQNGKFTEHTEPVNVGLALRVFDEKAIRPYGLLLKVQ